jgi:hypothetical protein
VESGARDGHRYPYVALHRDHFLRQVSTLTSPPPSPLLTFPASALRSRTPCKHADLSLLRCVDHVLTLAAARSSSRASGSTHARPSCSTSPSALSKPPSASSAASAPLASVTRALSSSRSCCRACSARACSTDSVEPPTTKEACYLAITASPSCSAATRSSSPGSPRTPEVSAAQREVPSAQKLKRGQADQPPRPHQEIPRRISLQRRSGRRQHCRASAVQQQPGARVPPGSRRGARHLHRVQCDLRVSRVKSSRVESPMVPPSPPHPHS